MSSSATDQPGKARTPVVSSPGRLAIAPSPVTLSSASSSLRMWMAGYAAAIRPSLPPRKRSPAGTPDRIAPSGPPAAGAAIPVRAGCAMADNTSPPCFVGGLAVVPPMGLDPALDACLRKVTGQVAARMSSGRYAVAAVRSQPWFPRSHLPGMAAGRRHRLVLDPSLLSRARKPGWWASSPDLAERTEPMRHAMEASA
jgi:hypothetical protein